MSAQSHIPAPYACTYSPNVPSLLWQLQCSLMVSTYQANKVIMLSALNPEQLVQLPRNFQKAMGMAVAEDQIAVASQYETTLLKNAPELAKNYGKQPGTYDALFLPRATFYTGEIDLHDMAWSGENLLAVNTRFSCISQIDEHFSFQPVWKPPFITQLVPTDCCHLNGMAFADGQLRFATALGTTDHEKGWRENALKGGVLMDVTSNEVVLEHLPMPHSPRIINGKLYLALSATGEIIEVSANTGTYEIVTKLNGFVRGMTYYQDYLFVGLSKLRSGSSTFRELPIASRDLQCGVEIIHLPSGTSAGFIYYQNTVEELYDIQVLPGCRRPGILNTEKEAHRQALVTPQNAYWAAPN